MEEREVIVLGGGPAGLAAAAALGELGVRDILVVERERELGGILRQCIHDGFGLTRFGESLSGPEYAQRFIEAAERRGVRCLTDAMALELGPGGRVVVTSRGGVRELRAKAVVLAMGCRERTRGALCIPGDRPAGVYTAGVAQAYLNLHNKMVGREIVILGSGDIGMIMARRLTLEGAKVKAVLEIQSYPSGLPRNVRQCLEDFEIPLRLGTTVVDIVGRSRLERIAIARVGADRRPIPGTEEEIRCDALILSVGLIPENELSIGAGVALDPRTRGPLVDEGYRTGVEGVFAAGNVLQVHDLVDFVSLEAEALARSVARYLGGGTWTGTTAEITAGEPILYTVPQRFGSAEAFTLSLRAARPLGTCELRLSQGGRTVKSQRLRKALPAEMIRVPIGVGELTPGERLEVELVC